MANEEQLSILKQGAEVWNKWRDEFDQKIDLDGADLRGVDLRYTDLTFAHLAKANLFKANLTKANLQVADLTKANLREANLFGSDLIGTMLKLANFNGADLREAVFFRNDIDRTNFRNAKLGFTVFTDVDLSLFIGLEAVDHAAISNIDFHTILRSKGKIPIAFLRGCGLSDLDIEYAKLADHHLTSEQFTDITYKIHQLYLGGGIKYYSCFISYSSKDQEFAQHLHDDLQNNGVRCWFDREDLKIGDAIRPTIDRQIRLRDKLLVILSENSIKSEWVGDEVEGALEEEQKGNRSVLFPIRLDDTVLNTRDDWAAKIKRRRHIGDFSNWQDKSSYQKAFERLLRDLKATGE